MRLLSLLVASLFALRPEAAGHRGGWHFYKWQQAHATFYGGADASGTMGGACGYGNLYTAGYGVLTAAASGVLFEAGLTCGACYRVQCVNQPGWSYCRNPSKSIVITITNLCPNNWALPSNQGGWCNYPRKHLDMSQPAWEMLAYYGAGIVPVNIARWPCARRGGVVFVLSGNPWYLEINVQNVAVSGDIRNIWLSTNRGQIWTSMDHNWGMVWSLHGNFWNRGLSFRLKSKLTGTLLTIISAIPPNWSVGQTFQTRGQFRMPRPRGIHKKGRRRKALDLGSAGFVMSGLFSPGNMTAAPLLH
eukprot:TRINITY_DN10171_c0_g1_i2.p1 TRINITY_DN10171_c0_g1~~TRINITY_DN10171_c0_g1_i2.p1  ORF type:complete len:303 (+),score=23.77 TRINITY_DN10171_c0_g1_i2:432-1340(+)